VVIQPAVKTSSILASEGKLTNKQQLGRVPAFGSAPPTPLLITELGKVPLLSVLEAAS
jgi:hypothetical protein